MNWKRTIKGAAFVVAVIITILVVALMVFVVLVILYEYGYFI